MDGASKARSHKFPLQFTSLRVIVELEGVGVLSPFETRQAQGTYGSIDGAIVCLVVLEEKETRFRFKTSKVGVGVEVDVTVK